MTDVPGSVQHDRSVLGAREFPIVSVAASDRGRMFNFATLVETIRLHWRTFAAVTTTVLGLGLGLGWVALALDQCVSTAQVLVSMQGSTTAEAYQNDEVVEARINSYIALLGTDVVSERLVGRLGLDMSPSELASRITATKVPPNTAIIDIAVTDLSSDQARKFAQAVAEEFVSYANAMETPAGEGAQKIQSTVVSAASHPKQRQLERMLFGVLVSLAALFVGATAVSLRALNRSLGENSASSNSSGRHIAASQAREAIHCSNKEKGRR